jgi:hypothetical protein
MLQLIRISRGYGRDGTIPVGRTEFYKRFIYHEGGDEYVAGIKRKVRRARRIPLGLRATALNLAQLQEIVAALIAEGDPTFSEQKQRDAETAAARDDASAT